MTVFFVLQLNKIEISRLLADGIYPRNLVFLLMLLGARYFLKMHMHEFDLKYQIHHRIQ
jgi:hypothetical protein